MTVNYINPKVRRTEPLTFDRLREVLDYDIVTGVFRWRISGRNRVPGAIAGGPCNGYTTIGIDGRRYKAARLAVFWMTGEWPAAHVDHRDGDKARDRGSNLRSVTPQQNQANAKIPRNNTSGFKGVRRVTSTGRFQAFITIGRRQQCLGTFPTASEAAVAYNAAALKAFGAFARINDTTPQRTP